MEYFNLPDPNKRFNFVMDKRGGGIRQYELDQIIRAYDRGDIIAIIRKEDYDKAKKEAEEMTRKNYEAQFGKDWH